MRSLKKKGKGVFFFKNGFQEKIIIKEKKQKEKCQSQKDARKDTDDAAGSTTNAFEEKFRVPKRRAILMSAPVVSADYQQLHLELIRSNLVFPDVSNI